MNGITHYLRSTTSAYGMFMTMPRHDNRIAYAWLRFMREQHEAKAA